MNPYIERTLSRVKQRNPNSSIFLQAVTELTNSLQGVLEDYPEFEDHNILERMCEPERQFQFQVTWMDDAGRVHVNRGFRIGFNGVLGPFKGGLRFHPSVNADIIKFLAFEQVYKNSLTGMPIGGGKGGSDFNPKGRSEREVMRFCQSFMNGLFRYIGNRTDVPAGDIGVGSREIGYLFGQYKKLTNSHETGVLTGKAVTMGGSLGRKEATGFGCVYFAQAMLAQQQKEIKGKTCIVSGSGNVALYVIKKLIELGATVVACSDSNGMLYDPKGLNWETLHRIKEVERKRLQSYIGEHPHADYRQGQKVWQVPCELAFPCATQNELDFKDAQALVKNGCQLVCEGANMPSTPQAVDLFHENSVLYAPGKASNAGGVVVSAIEMRQNASLDSWTFDVVDSHLKTVMISIHNNCLKYADRYQQGGNYMVGANIAGFLRVARAMVSNGIN